MATERELQEAGARCLATMAFYQSAGHSGEATDFMEMELRQVYLWVSRVLTWSQIVGAIVRPVEDGLVARYGQGVGASLHATFLRALRCEDERGGVSHSPRISRATSRAPRSSPAR